ncbi:MAG TPA: glutamate--tRNA ligase [Candidatus Eisenbacteria bacterium]|jgi:glutamyl-tRNA synthetase
MSVRVRFAPSPTGYLHVGGARTALFNYLFARRHGGVFVLRIEDTDAARSTDEAARAIVSSLRWLGLGWDEGPEAGGGFGPYFQSARRERYHARAAALAEAGNAYRCTCTAEELEARRAEQVRRGEPPRYDGRCRNLDAAERARLEAGGRAAALRFRAPAEGETAWEDVVRGRVAFANAVLDDFVLLRSDGHPTYNFACVVDDHEMEITHVIRGDDHISNTPRQILLYQAFGWSAPRFAHVPMILGADGSRLSKRHGATSVEAFRDLGILPEALVNFLALLGWSYDGQQELFGREELEQKFSLERVGSNPAVFNLEKLEWMNGQHLKAMPEEERVRRVEEYLAARGYDLGGRTPEWRRALVRAIGDRLKTLADAERYGAFALKAELEVDEASWAEMRERPGVAERLEALAKRLGALPEFTLEALERETRGLAAELGIKAGEVISIARVALTGRKVSPGIFEVMWLLGRERTVGRLEDAATRWRAETQAGRV